MFECQNSLVHFLHQRFRLGRFGYLHWAYSKRSKIKELFLLLYCFAENETHFVGWKNSGRLLYAIGSKSSSCICIIRYTSISSSKLLCIFPCIQKFLLLFKIPKKIPSKRTYIRLLDKHFQTVYCLNDVRSKNNM